MTCCAMIYNVVQCSTLLRGMVLGGNFCRSFLILNFNLRASIFERFHSSPSKIIVLSVRTDFFFVSIRRYKLYLTVNVIFISSCRFYR